MRSWIVRSLLKPEVWESGLDTLLLGLRSTIQEFGSEGFPLLEIEQTMSRFGKSLRFEDDEIDDLASIKYGDKRSFSMLSLLYPGMNFRNEFHIDHVFPRSRFSKRKLKAEGIASGQIDNLNELREQLPNLQLMEGSTNVAKQDQLPSVWISEHLKDDFARASYRDRHDLGEIPLDIDEFEAFFRARQSRMSNRLKALLGVPSLQSRV